MLYFAYGSNIDKQAMQARCPKSQVLGVARLAKHAIFVMEDGYASIRPDARAFVHGVLYDLALSDVPALDRYEDVARGLYRKVRLPVLRKNASPVVALAYVGWTQNEGRPKTDYWRAIVKAAVDWELPPLYVAALERLDATPREFVKKDLLR